MHKKMVHPLWLPLLIVQREQGNKILQNVKEPMLKSHAIWIKNFLYWRKIITFAVSLHAIVVPLEARRRGGGWDVFIHKGVYWRFGLDDPGISQVHKSLSRTKQRERPWDVNAQPALCPVGFTWCKVGGHIGHTYILTSAWGFRRCSFRQTWAMREPSDRGTGSRHGSTFFCMRTQYCPK